jgi:hypothetical protein
VPLVTRTVELIEVLPVDVQVAPVMPPPPLELELLELLLDEELLELLLDELEDELDEPLFENEQYRGLPTLMDGNSEPWQVIGPVSVAYTKVPDLP